MALSGRILPWVAGLAALTLAAGLVWGFFLTPDDYKQGSTVKIIYIHVPAASAAINAWAVMLIASLVWIVRRHHVSALVAKAAAPPPPPRKKTKPTKGSVERRLKEKAGRATVKKMRGRVERE